MSQYFGDFEEEQRKRKVQQWLELLESDLGGKVISELPDAEATGSEEADGSLETELRPDQDDLTSITNHEFSLEMEGDDWDPSGGDEEAEEEMIADPPGKGRFFHKAMRTCVKKVILDTLPPQPRLRCPLLREIWR